MEFSQIIKLEIIKKCTEEGSNLQPPGSKPGALSIELSVRLKEHSTQITKKMQTYRCEGIILHTLDFRDYDKIVSAFTAEYGLLKFIARKANAAKRGLKVLPLTKTDLIYTTTQSELYKLKDLSLIAQYLPLRQNLAFLHTACELLKCVLKTQLPQKPAPDLYGLLCAYLEKIPKVSTPALIEASFRLKLLRHEGLFDENSTFFSPQEIPLVHDLAFSLSYEQLDQIPLSHELNFKIKSFFELSIHQ